VEEINEVFDLDETKPFGKGKGGITDWEEEDELDYEGGDEI